MSEAVVAEQQAAGPSMPSLADLRAELAHERRRSGKRRAVATVLGTLAVVAGISVVISTFLVMVMQIRGTSMEPTLHEGDVIATTRSTSFQTGDVMAFYYNNKVLLKRVIAFPGDWVDISSDGTVSVNGTALQEDYVADVGNSQTDITFPYQVPDNHYFVLGDHRSVSIDSRSNVIGTVAQEQVIGKVVFRVWPLPQLGPIH
jgi:signal peptidase I